MSKNLAKRVADLCIEEVLSTGKNCPENAGVVVNYHPPHELEQILADDLKLTETGCSEDEFVALCKRFVDFSCKTWHPRFMCQLFSGIDTFSLCASWVMESLNTSSYTFEAAPVITLVQRSLIDEVRKMFGFPSGDGVFCPGASLANMYAMMLARQRRFPDIKRTGLSGLSRMVIFTSDVSHYSVEKGAVFLGFGLDAVVKVESDEAGVILPDKLREAIKGELEKGRIPLMVNATAGTTMLGSFDQLDAIATVCDEFNFPEGEKIWLHCDAAFGGSAIFSKKSAHLLKGSERLDSVTWDFHKIAGVLLQCSLILTKHGYLLRESISANAGYLFQMDKGYDVSYDSGDKSVQCSQKPDALKWWLLWKAKGSVGMEAEINALLHMAEFAQQKIRELVDEGFQLIMPKFQYVNVCFWYIPSWMRKSDGKSDSTHHSLLGKVPAKVRARLRESGKLLINSASHKSLPSYFRIVCSNRLLTEDEIISILYLIRDTAESIPQSEFY